MPRVTFVTHDASRTGAPSVLLSLMRWLRGNTDLELMTLAVLPGPLLGAFGQLGPVRVLDSYAPRASEGDHQAEATERINRILTEERDVALRELRETDLLYANCLESHAGVAFARRGQPLLVHLHEGDDYLRSAAFQRFVDPMCRGADRIVASSSGVRDLLVNDVGVRADAVRICYPFIDVEGCARTARTLPDMRSRLGIAPDAFVVGMSGWASWKKAPDIFVAVAREVLRRVRDDIVFIWVGGDEWSADYRYPARDVERLGLARQIRFFPHQENVLPYLAVFDALFLSSRADVFPLVCLEAAIVAETPIVCFEGAGEMTELVADGCGYVVPYLDVDEAATALLDLRRDPGLRSRMGRRAAELVRERHDVTKAAPRIHAVISELL